MTYECINPADRDVICEMMEASIEEIAGFDLGGPAELGDARLHWNCCPACRHEFPSLPAVLEQAGRKMDQVFAASLCLMKDHFLAQKTSLATAASDGNPYPAMIAALASAEDEVHSELHHALVTGTMVYRGEGIEFDPYSRPLLLLCQEFISSLEPDLQHFVFPATLSFELLRPMWERVGLSAREATPEEIAGLPPREDPYTPEEIIAGITAVAERRAAQPPVNLEERLQQAIAGSGLEPKVLWEIIDAAASAHVGGREGAGAQLLLETRITKFEEIFDNFESIKPTQNVQVRLSERSIRKAADYGPEVAARVGPWLYSQLREATKDRLNAAEFLYAVNRQEPMYSHGPVMSLAFAYENELKFQLAYPIVNDLANTGVETYPAERRDGKKPYRPLIARAQIQHENMALGSIAWHLWQADFRASNHRFDPVAICSDADAVVEGRNKAAHLPVSELAEADKLRSLILRPDGILSRLHPGTTNNSSNNSKI